MKVIRLLAVLLLSIPAICQSGDQGLQAAVTAGNQAWIDGMRSGNAALIVSVYTPDAINCGVDGVCVTGAANIEAQLRSRLAGGRARTANVTSTSVVRDRDLGYEWGYAEASMANGRPINGRYITVWQRQPAGGWKILRNLSLPAERGGRDYGRPDRPGRGVEQSFTVRCDSDDMGRHTCAAPVQITRAVMSRQVSGSACTQGQTWGWQGDSIWVDRGCRAEFTVYGHAAYANPSASDQTVSDYNDPRFTRTLRCESDNMGYRLCAAEGSLRGARLTRQISGSACTEGQTWGWKTEGVWVDRGCRADFEVTLR